VQVEPRTKVANRTNRIIKEIVARVNRGGKHPPRQKGITELAAPCQRLL
jgi:hypothetical protein